VNPIRLLLADDHTLVRAGLRALLQGVAGVQVIAEADNGREALRLVEEQRPDVVLMDIQMAGLNGLEAAAGIAREYPRTRVIMLSMHADEEYVVQALRAGASGYLLKNAGAVELAEAIKRVAQGETFLSPAVAGQVGDYIRRVGQEPTSLDRLTPRQREILQLIAEGNTTKKIAQVLTISVKTVETHRSQLMEQLDIHDIAGLVRYAIRMRLVTPET
jgi:DNA-binding NarL/FixJ family response regulator